MDPLTAGLQLANTIAQIVLMNLQAMTPDQRAQMVSENIKQLHDVVAFFERIIPK